VNPLDSHDIEGSNRVQMGNGRLGARVLKNGRQLIPEGRMKFSMNRWKLAVGLLAMTTLGLAASRPASASICLTSGKVYVQQKVYDKASWFLECARKAEPENLDVLSLLAFARAQQRQYISAGAAFQIGIDVATKKKDDKRVQDLERNRLAVNAQLFNAGVSALNRAGAFEVTSDRTTGDETTPQGKAEKEYGVPHEFVKIKEKSGEHEFWYYPEAKVMLYFAPGADEVKKLDYVPYEGMGDPQAAVVDTVAFPSYSGISTIAEAAYDFELASYVDPSSLETYQNLAFIYSQMGRTDDAIHAAQRGLKIKPDDDRLHRNLRAAVMTRAQRLYDAGKYVEAIQAFRDAIVTDPSSAPGYQLRIADAWLKRAEASTKGSPDQKAAYDSAAVGFGSVLEQPSASDSLKQNALYNEAVIYANQESYPKAIEVLDKGGALYPNNKDIWSLNGQVKYQAKDYKGAVVTLKHALELDPTDAANHQFLFLSLHETGDKENSVAEYSIYKALSEGTKKDPKVWVDSAVNRLGAQTQTTMILKSEGYPEEVYTYREESKVFETWFFWSKGKSVTFLDGQIFSKGAFPPKKSS
jgi:tetratricopeptide (TPR) repeat protein